jgi:hypothetical protein
MCCCATAFAAPQVHADLYALDTPNGFHLSVSVADMAMPIDFPRVSPQKIILTVSSYAEFQTAFKDENSCKVNDVNINFNSMRITSTEVSIDLTPAQSYAIFPSPAFVPAVHTVLSIECFNFKIYGDPTSKNDFTIAVASTSQKSNIIRFSVESTKFVYFPRVNIDAFYDTRDVNKEIVSVTTFNLTNAYNNQSDLQKWNPTKQQTFVQFAVEGCKNPSSLPKVLFYRDSYSLIDPLEMYSIVSVGAISHINTDGITTYKIDITEAYEWSTLTDYPVTQFQLRANFQCSPVSTDSLIRITGAVFALPDDSDSFVSYKMSKYVSSQWTLPAVRTFVDTLSRKFRLDIDSPKLHSIRDGKYVVRVSSFDKIYRFVSIDEQATTTCDQYHRATNSVKEPTPFGTAAVKLTTKNDIASFEGDVIDGSSSFDLVIDFDRSSWTDGMRLTLECDRIHVVKAWKSWSTYQDDFIVTAQEIDSDGTTVMRQSSQYSSFISDEVIDWLKKALLIIIVCVVVIVVVIVVAIIACCCGCVACLSSTSNSGLRPAGNQQGYTVHVNAAPYGQNNVQNIQGQYQPPTVSK